MLLYHLHLVSSIRWSSTPNTWITDTAKHVSSLGIKQVTFFTSNANSLTPSRSGKLIREITKRCPSSVLDQYPKTPTVENADKFQLNIFIFVVDKNLPCKLNDTLQFVRKTYPVYRRAKHLMIVINIGKIRMRVNFDLFRKLLIGAWKNFRLLDISMIVIDERTGSRNLLYYGPFDKIYHIRNLNSAVSLFSDVVRVLKKFKIRGKVNNENWKWCIDVFPTKLPPSQFMYVNFAHNASVGLDEMLKMELSYLVKCRETGHICTLFVDHVDFGTIVPIIYETGFIRLPPEIILSFASFFAMVLFCFLVAKACRFSKIQWSYLNIYQIMLVSKIKVYEYILTNFF